LYDNERGQNCGRRKKSWKAREEILRGGGGGVPVVCLVYCPGLCRESLRGAGGGRSPSLPSWAVCGQARIGTRQASQGAWQAGTRLPGLE